MTRLNGGLGESLEVRMKHFGIDSLEAAESVPEPVSALNGRYQEVKSLAAEAAGSSP